MEDDELPTQSIPFFTAFWFLKGNQTTNIFLWNRKITWFPNECMVKLWDFHPKMVHGLTWYYIDASFNLLFWTGFMDLIFSETPEEILLSPSLSVDPWLIVFVPGAVFLRTRFFCNIRRRWFFFEKKTWRLFTLFLPYSWFRRESGGVIWKGNYCWRIHPFFTEPGLSGRIRVIRSCWWLLMVPKHPAVQVGHQWRLAS